jgi:hypothetical protein
MLSCSKWSCCKREWKVFWQGMWAGSASKERDQSGSAHENMSEHDCSPVEIAPVEAVRGIMTVSTTVCLC